MSTSILMACYIMLQSGQYDWVQGRETREMGAKRDSNFADERSLFVPHDERIKPRVVNVNDCKYLEDPVFAYNRELEARKIDQIKVGKEAWCHVDEWGRSTCTYKTVEQCMKRVKRGDYCEPNKP